MNIWAIDIAIERWIDTGRGALPIDVFYWITMIGDARVIIVTIVAIAIVFFRHRLWGYKAGFAVALFGSIAMSEALKYIVARPRPLPPFPLLDVPGYSFPSMHATVSVATFGFLAYAVMKRMHPPHLRKIVASFLILLPFLIGFSRVYLGVHYPSDVLAGWLIGAVLLWIGILVAERYTH
jgi:undecaprenyl-diphosphatase